MANRWQLSGILADVCTGQSNDFVNLFVDRFAEFFSVVPLVHIRYRVQPTLVSKVKVSRRSRQWTTKKQKWSTFVNRDSSTSIPKQRIRWIAIKSIYTFWLISSRDRFLEFGDDRRGSFVELLERVKCPRSPAIRKVCFSLSSSIASLKRPRAGVYPNLILFSTHLFNVEWSSNECTRPSRMIPMSNPTFFGV